MIKSFSTIGLESDENLERRDLIAAITDWSDTAATRALMTLYRQHKQSNINKQVRAHRASHGGADPPTLPVPENRLVPAPLLVGIELNPGPNPPKKYTKRAVKAAVSAASAALVQKVKKKKQPKRKPQSRTVSANQLLVRSYTNPFHVSPPRLGFGLIGPSSQMTAWSRNSYTPSGYVAILFNPNQVINLTGSWVTVFTSTTNTTLLAANSTTLFVPSNVNALLTMAETGRPITAGLRATMGLNLSTGAFGQASAGLITDSYTGIISQQYSALNNLDSMYPVVPDIARNNMIEVNYRPGTTTDLTTFNILSAATSVNVVQTYMLIIYYGQLNPTTGSVQAISHLETVGGILQGAQDSEDVTVSSSMTIEQLGMVLRDVCPVKSGLAVTLEDAAFRNVAFRAHSGVNISANQRRGLYAEDSNVPQTVEDYDVVSRAGNIALAGLTASTLLTGAGAAVLNYGANQIIARQQHVR